MSLWVTKFTVEGRDAFPLDMLRYDGCYPASSEDTTKMSDSLDREGRRAFRNNTGKTPTYFIDLIATRPLRGWEPTTGRWESFGWHVVQVKPSYKHG